jgi:2-succinyl-6-hydroxy-2,4-cyclohexadiene-1-carboxylate synthase
MPTFEIDKTRYHYVEAGAGEPLLLLHGFTGCTDNWREVMAQLQSRHRVIAIDLPGHGKTEAPNAVTHFTMPVIAQQISTFIEGVIGAPAHVLGYSMGGRLALFLALHHPHRVKTLRLESASPGLATEEARRARIASDEALALRIERDGITTFVDAWERLPLFASQTLAPAQARDRLRALRLQNDAAGLALSLRGMGTGAQPSLWERLHEWTKPALFITGALDAKFVEINKQMALRMPRATHHIVAAAGHAVHFEQPQWYAASVANRI